MNFKDAYKRTKDFLTGEDLHRSYAENLHASESKHEASKEPAETPQNEAETLRVPLPKRHSQRMSILPESYWGERTELTPSLESQEAQGVASTESIYEKVASDPALTSEQKEVLNDPQVKETVVTEAANAPAYGKRFKHWAGSAYEKHGRKIDFAAGAALGVLARKTVNAVAPGMGTVAGAAAGGLSGWWRASRAEARRVEEVKNYLANTEEKEAVTKVQQYLKLEEKLARTDIPSAERSLLREELTAVATEIQQAEWKKVKGLQRLKKLAELRSSTTEEDAFRQDKESKKLLREINKDYSTKKDRRAIAAGIFRGSLYGGVGGYMGELISSWLADKAEHATAEIGNRTTAVQEYWRAAKEGVAGKIEDSRPMHGSVWNTVKEFFREQGIENPSDKLVNQATRIITDINQVEITGDHATTAGQLLHNHIAEGVRDIAMRADTPLKGFEQLQSLVQQQLPNSLEEVRVTLPHAHIGVELVSETNHTEYLMKAAGALGVLGGGEIAARKIEGREKEEKIVSEKAETASEKLNSQYKAAMGILDDIEHKLNAGEDIDAFSRHKEVWAAFPDIEQQLPDNLKSDFLQKRHEIGSRYEILVARSYEKSPKQKLRNNYRAAMSMLDEIERRLNAGEAIEAFAKHTEVWAAFPDIENELPEDLKKEYVQKRHEIGSRYELLVARSYKAPERKIASETAPAETKPEEQAPAPAEPMPEEKPEPRRELKSKELRALKDDLRARIEGDNLSAADIEQLAEQYGISELQLLEITFQTQGKAKKNWHKLARDSFELLAKGGTRSLDNDRQRLEFYKHTMLPDFLRMRAENKIHAEKTAEQKDLEAWIAKAQQELVKITPFLAHMREALKNPTLEFAQKEEAYAVNKEQVDAILEALPGQIPENFAKQVGAAIREKLLQQDREISALEQMHAELKARESERDKRKAPQFTESERLKREAESLHVEVNHWRILLYDPYSRLARLHLPEQEDRAVRAAVMNYARTEDVSYLEPVLEKIYDHGELNSHETNFLATLGKLKPDKKVEFSQLKKSISDKYKTSRKRKK